MKEKCKKRRILTGRILWLALGMMLWGGMAMAQRVIYVKTGGSGDGGSWTTALGDEIYTTWGYLGAKTPLFGAGFGASVGYLFASWRNFKLYGDIGFNSISVKSNKKFSDIVPGGPDEKAKWNLGGILLQIRGTFGFWNKPRPKDDDDDDDDDDNPSLRKKRLFDKLRSIKDSTKKDTVTADSVSADSASTTVVDSVKASVTDSVGASVADSAKVNVTDSAKVDSSTVKDSLAADSAKENSADTTKLNAANSAKVMPDTTSVPPQPANKPEENPKTKGD